jgi:predicted membrane-bound mannosyltransferase
VLAAIGVALTALAVLAIGLALHLHDRPRRRGLYSVAAEQAIAEVAIAAPLVLTMVGACLVLRRQLAAARDPEGSQRPGGR